MCGIFGIYPYRKANPNLKRYLRAADLIAHRGPDDSGTYIDDKQCVGLAHKRLSIIDLTAHGHQPMRSKQGHVIVFNGEIYNYQELRSMLEGRYDFTSHTDTEVILALYQQYGSDCLSYLRGMFAFAIYHEGNKTLFCARDRFGIKPFYYTHQKDYFVFASEIKALLPFLPELETNQQVLGEYLTFQYALGHETLFSGVNQLMPGHYLVQEGESLRVEKYWDVNYTIDHDQTDEALQSRLDEYLNDSIQYHLRSDVPVGSYLSGGVDSSLITQLASEHSADFYGSFHGKFLESPDYDESHYARAVADNMNKPLFEAVITSSDFIHNIHDIIYHLDTPVAGPGAFPQYMVSKLAAKHVKVILGGQGGDEIFGGYARYLLAYFEQTIRAAIDGTYQNGNYVVTPESIIPNLTLLKSYKPLMKSFWQQGLFEDIDKRYFRLVDRSVDMQAEVDWGLFDQAGIFTRFQQIFSASDNVHKEAYFDKMTHFDFKCLLPALLQVEDRVSMAHGLESRVPFLDHKLIELVARVSADKKFPGGKMKHLLQSTFADKIPTAIAQRNDKMGFPVPLREWFTGEVGDFIKDIFSSQAARERGFYHPDKVLASIEGSGQYTRKIWGLLSLELWHTIFHEDHKRYQCIIEET